MSIIYWILGLLTGLFAGIFLPVIKKMKWYYWLLTVAAYLFIVLAISFAGTSFAEHQPKAGVMGLVLFGIIGIVLSVLAYIFGMRPFVKKSISTGHPVKEAM